MPDDARGQKGRDTFHAVLGFEARAPATPLTQAAQDFIFAEVWSRPGLDRRSRRWITLAAVTAAGAPTAMRTYARAALDSGDITMAELREFVLQFAVFQGFPKAVEFELILNGLDAAPPQDEN
ncbi:carboxymuconolactone decarboxylase family protein [Acidocella sp.]|uniref:carboxymuconolactone decarboxylase family protein n=1 Tax=Acidocella sp. TaxID=50710 RepID=UPI002606BE2D|nr:carboxymuconolactone decarboxylase family protein [Acidocella sp.]